MSKILILSDIHGNLNALTEVLEVTSEKEIDGMIILGDCIDYGPESNEVLEVLMKISSEKILVNIWGNHEEAVVNEHYDRFSSERGVDSARYTKHTLTSESIAYINQMNSSGMEEFYIQDKKCLAIHGSLEDVYWTSIQPGEDDDRYLAYDWVFSGHSHISHCYPVLYPCDNEHYRNKKRTMFLNPGSVGQPRNHNPYAQCAIWDVERDSVELLAIPYDVEGEMRQFTDAVDDFYRERLKWGI